MKEYFAALFVMAAILSVIRLLGYKSATLERLALGIICLYLLVAPIGSIGEGGVDGLFDIPEIKVENGADSVLCDAVCRGVSSAVAAEFGLKNDDISVRLFDFDSETMRAGQIEIILSGAALTADYRMIESFVNKMEIGEARVEISFGK